MKKSFKFLIGGIIASVVILVVIVALLVGKLVTHKKTPAAFEQFSVYAEEQGYIFEEETDMMPEGFGKYGVAYQENEDQDFVITFSECPDVEGAVKLYNKSESLITEEYKGAVSSHVNVNLGNYSKYEQTSDGIFAAVARVENTVLFVHSKAEDKEELQDFIKGLGY
ncbi:hypothetical protein GPL15_18375 [Clostridium sp. MCC353]|uniref:hypothetical protein n=1 Tax=Clostridium sp. MCC353 TaxID=2592646 RepID=UPI001C023AF8|nr:hypothetical protein [Clostridium sp. MCC353]MBT9778468.1 hypothetical protein [Clostridium sp. MCC353]